MAFNPANFNPAEFLSRMGFFHGRGMTAQPTQEEVLLTDDNRAFLTPGAVLDASVSDPGFAQDDAAIDSLLRNEFNLMESQADREKKELALLRLNDILKSWMNQVNQMVGVPPDPSGTPSISNSAILLCYGSYKLGVSTPTGDMDTLVLVPKYVNRDVHFFGLLHRILEQMARENEHIKDLTAINYEHSVTPLIKMVFYDVSVDMVFASVEDVSALNGEIRPSGLSVRANLYNDSFLQSAAMDDKMQRSYNGFRNAEMILNSMFTEAEKRVDALVERRINNFRMTLRCLKKIADLNGLKENKYGYIGGISFALMTAKVVQLFPNYCFAQLLERFLWLFGTRWDWNAWPVLIVDQLKEPNRAATNGYPRGPVQEHVAVFDYFWNRDKRRGMATRFAGGMAFQQPLNKRYMSVVTPAWPQMNSTYNVVASTRAVIVKLFRAKHAEILHMRAQHQLQNEAMAAAAWKRYFRKFEFFREFDQYIEIIIACRDDDAQFLRWKGYIESKIRILIDKLELMLKVYSFDIQIWPFVFPFDEVRLTRPHHPRVAAFPLKERMYIGIRANEDYSEPIDLNGAISSFVWIIQDKWTKENGPRNPDEMDLFIYLVDQDTFDLETPKPPSLVHVDDIFGVREPQTPLNHINVNMLRTASMFSDHDLLDKGEALNRLLD